MQNSKIGKTRPKEPEHNKHHIVPKCPDKNPRVIVVDAELHKCYHKLFGNPKSYKDACTILLRDWWTDRNGNFIK